MDEERSRRQHLGFTGVGFDLGSIGIRTFDKGLCRALIDSLCVLKMLLEREERSMCLRVPAGVRTGHLP